jgi:phosphoribosyl-dephospho-CoA transferase MdcG
MVQVQELLKPHGVLVPDRCDQVGVHRDVVRAVLSSLSARTDCLIETGEGAMALEELTSGAGEVLLRAAGGPRLIRVPWRPGS